jgi:hypothetical protein
MFESKDAPGVLVDYELTDEDHAAVDRINAEIKRLQIPITFSFVMTNKETVRVAKFFNILDGWMARKLRHRARYERMMKRK